MKLSDLTQVKERLGTNPGGVFKDDDGQLYYVKYVTPEGEDQARDALLANKLYQAAGLDCPQVMPIYEGGQLVATATKWEDITPLSSALQSDFSQLDGLYEGFCVDCLLANWDVIGEVFDNLHIREGSQRAFRLDFGGCLRFRALGDKKGDAFADEVQELESFFLFNEQARHVFRGILDNPRYYLEKSLKRVLALSDDIIRTLAFETHGEKGAELALKIIRRKASLIRKINTFNAEALRRRIEQVEKESARQSFHILSHEQKIRDAFFRLFKFFCRKPILLSDGLIGFEGNHISIYVARPDMLCLALKHLQIPFILTEHHGATPQIEMPIGSEDKLNTVIQKINTSLDAVMADGQVSLSQRLEIHLGITETPESAKLVPFVINMLNVTVKMTQTFIPSTLLAVGTEGNNLSLKAANILIWEEILNGLDIPCRVFDATQFGGPRIEIIITSKACQDEFIAKMQSANRRFHQLLQSEKKPIPFIRQRQLLNECYKMKYAEPEQRHQQAFVRPVERRDTTIDVQDVLSGRIKLDVRRDDNGKIIDLLLIKDDESISVMDWLLTTDWHQVVIEPVKDITEKEQKAIGRYLCHDDEYQEANELFRDKDFCFLREYIKDSPDVKAEERVLEMLRMIIYCASAVNKAPQEERLLYRYISDENFLVGLAVGQAILLKGLTSTTREQAGFGGSFRFDITAFRSARLEDIYEWGDSPECESHLVPNTTLLIDEITKRELGRAERGDLRYQTVIKAREIPPSVESLIRRAQRQFRERHEPPQKGPI